MNIASFFASEIPIGIFLTFMMNLKSNLPLPIFIQSVVVSPKWGIEQEFASKLVQMTVRYNADIYIEKDGIAIDAKSIFWVMMLSAGHGCEITIGARGNDAEKAVNELSKLIESDFDI